MKWCADHGIPHSELLSWDPADRSKLMAHLVDTASTCQSCGTASWEWDDDKFAYSPGTSTCRGCMLLDAAKEDFDPGPGTRMILIPKERATQLTGG